MQGSWNGHDCMVGPMSGVCSIRNVNSVQGARGVDLMTGPQTPDSIAQVHVESEFKLCRGRGQPPAQRTCDFVRAHTHDVCLGKRLKSHPNLNGFGG